MADTQITGTLSVDNAINGSLSANEGINGSLTPDEEISGTLEVTRTRVVATMLSELEDVELDDLQDDDILVYDSLDGKWHNEEQTAGGGTWGTITGTLSDQTDLQDALDSKYDVGDTPETDIQDGDYIPFYDDSASAKRKSLWSNIKAKLNEIFFRRSEQAVLGAKNLLSWAGASSPSSIWTPMDDGTLVANGTDTSANAMFSINIPSELSGDFYISGCPANGAPSKYDLYAWDATAGERPKKWDGVTESESDYGGTSQEIKVPSGHVVRVTCRVWKDVTVNNIVFRPMLRMATDTDDTFVPFAMSNKQLTDAVTQDASDIDAIEALIPSSASSSNKLATASDIPDITGKADLVTSATSGDFAGLDTNGNLTDSGISADIVPSGASSSNKLATANDIPSLSNYVEKSETAGLLKNDGTVDTTQYISDISGKVDNSVVAPVESGLTASRAYAIGEHFIRDGAFCTAKTAIALGADFTLGTNYTAGNIGDILSLTSFSNIGSLGIKGYKYGRIATIDFEAMTGIASSASAGTTLFTLPDALKPNSYVGFLETLNKRRCTIAANGNVSCSDALSAGAVLRGAVTYITSL